MAPRGSKCWKAATSARSRQGLTVVCGHFGSQGPCAGRQCCGVCLGCGALPGGEGNRFPFPQPEHVIFQGEQPWAGRTPVVPSPGEGWPVWATFQGVNYHGNTFLPREQSPGWLVKEAVTRGKAGPCSVYPISAVEFRLNQAACPAGGPPAREGSHGTQTRAALPPLSRPSFAAESIQEHPCWAPCPLLSYSNAGSTDWAPCWVLGAGETGG